METHFAEQTEKEKNLLKAHHEELTNIEFKHKNYQLPNLSKHTFPNLSKHTFSKPF